MFKCWMSWSMFKEMFQKYIEGSLYVCLIVKQFIPSPFIIVKKTVFSQVTIQYIKHLLQSSTIPESKMWQVQIYCQEFLVATI